MIRVIELFSGVGAQRMALRNIGVPHESVGVCEIDKYAHKSYEAIHGPTPNFGDITKVEKLPAADLWTYSFPCFVKGTMVLTSHGYKVIEDITSEDYVMTHKNRFMKVIKPMINMANKTYTIKTMCSDDIITTEEHPFYVRKLNKVWDSVNKKRIRVFGEPEWVNAKNLNNTYYVGTPMNVVEELPIWSGTTHEWSDGRSSRQSNIVSDLLDKEDFWWIIGAYIGDGWIRSQGGVIICGGENKIDQYKTHLDNLGLSYSIVKEKTVYKLHISVIDLGNYVSQFGRGASNKRLTSDILNLPKNLLSAFIDGYLATDGYIDKNGVYKISSVSKELIYGIGQCVVKVFNRPFSVYHTKRKPTCVIEGRTVNQKDSYVISWKLDTRKQDKAFFENGYAWSPINDVVVQEEQVVVYNMEVETDNSYVVQNIAVHNCTDLSQAGNQAGMSRDSNTRSGLLWEVERLLMVSEKPKYLLLENVKPLVGNKFKVHFDEWCDFLSSIGYKNYWKVLNAKDFDVPQNRERVFMVSILGDETFSFPTSKPLTKRLKDVLESNVNQKYYLKEEFTSKFIKKIEKKNSFTKDAIQKIGHLDLEGRHESACRVYGLEGIAPTIPTGAGGGHTPKVLEDCVIYTMGRGDFKDNLSENSPSITTSCWQHNNMLLEIHSNDPQVLKKERNEYGKSIRKAYESGIIEEKISNLFDLTPRTDGVSNTITTVLKDNLLYEPNCLTERRSEEAKELRKTIRKETGKDFSPRRAKEIVPRTDGISNCLTTSSTIEQVVVIPEEYMIGAIRGRKLEGDDTYTQTLDPNYKGVSNTLTTAQKDNVVINSSNRGFSIRKLTPLECWRLMGFSDSDFEKASNANSDTQLYKQAGNSIVVPVLEGIFRSMFCEDKGDIEIKPITDDLF